jgi:23S rRNA pseudouridine2457 synthase
LFVLALILFNKPCGVLTQFTPAEGRLTLRDFIPVPGVYPAGRLDADSEGLLVLTDEGKLQARLADPRYKLPKTYWAQVEGNPEAIALAELERGVDLGDFVTQSCRVRPISEPANLWPRDPPIRFRRDIPTSWIELVISEGKNRQVRRMTARIGHPTLRLIRWAVGLHNLEGLQPGHWRMADIQPGPWSTSRRVGR